MSQTLKNFTEELQTAIAPLVPNSYLSFESSAMGGSTMFLRFSAEPKEQWAHNIWHNSTNLLAAIRERNGGQIEMEVSMFCRQGFGKLGVKLLTKKTAAPEVVKAHLVKWFFTVGAALNGTLDVKKPEANPDTAITAIRDMEAAADAKTFNAAMKKAAKALGIEARVRIINSYNFPKCYIELIPADTMPNALRAFAVRADYANPEPRDWNNVSYGNIQPNRVCLHGTEKWVKVLRQYAEQLTAPAN